MPQPNHEKPGKLGLVTGSPEDGRFVPVLLLDASLLDGTPASDRIRRIAGEPHTPDWYTIDDTQRAVEEGDTISPVSLGTPWGNPQRLSPATYTVTQLGDSHRIEQVPLHIGDLLWLGDGGYFDDYKLRHLLPSSERLSVKSIRTVLANRKHRLEEHLRALKQQEKEYFKSLPEVDPSQPVNLFEGVEVQGVGEERTFTVPPRKIQTTWGELAFTVSGRGQLLKEHWQYGTPRVIQHISGSGDVESISGWWMPHVYLCEPTEHGLPLVTDQERLSVVISIGNPYREVPYEITDVPLGLSTTRGVYDIVASREAFWQEGNPTHVRYDTALANDDTRPYQLSLREYGEALGLRREYGDDTPLIREKPPRTPLPREILIPVTDLRSSKPGVFIDFTNLTERAPTA